MEQHEVSEGFIRQVGKGGNYYMRLVVEGKKRKRAVGTADYDDAINALVKWRTEEAAGIQADTRLRYEALRNAYLQDKNIQASVLRDLDMFFKDIRVPAITVKKLNE